MSRRRAPTAVVRASTMGAAVTVGLLAWVVVAVAAPWLASPRSAVASAVAAAWGAAAGALDRARALGVVRRTGLRLAWAAGVVTLGAALLVASGIAVAPDPRLLAGVALMGGAFGAGRVIGRIHRRQADPLTTDAGHQAADLSLVAALLVGVGVVIAAVTVAAVTTGPATVPAWVAPTWLVVAVLAIVAVRPVVLRARSRTERPVGRGWARATTTILAVVVVTVGVVGLAAVIGARLGIAVDVPRLPLPADVAELPIDRAPVASAPEPPPTTDQQSPVILWTVALAVAVLAVIALRPRGRRRPLPVLRGPGMPLLAFLRSLLSRAERREQPGGEETALPTTPPPVATVTLVDRLPAWARRLRPRPRDPAAAILFDYRRAQRALAAPARRRPSETVLAHARRHDVDGLAELAGLVCAIRFAGRRATPADAARSRELARRVSGR